MTLTTEYLRLQQQQQQQQQQQEQRKRVLSLYRQRKMLEQMLTTISQELKPIY